MRQGFTTVLGPSLGFSFFPLPFATICGVDQPRRGLDHWFE
jgi:hypothetical protein